MRVNGLMIQWSPAGMARGLLLPESIPSAILTGSVS